VTGAGSVYRSNSPHRRHDYLDSGGLLQLAGNFVTATLGTSRHSAGTAEITGNLDNTGNTLTAPGGGAYALSGTLKSARASTASPRIRHARWCHGHGNITIGNNTLTLKNSGAGATGTTTMGTAGVSNGSSISTPPSRRSPAAT